MSDTFAQVGQVLGQVYATLERLPLDETEEHLDIAEAAQMAAVGPTAYTNSKLAKLVDAERNVITAAKRLAKACKKLAAVQSE